MTDTQPSPRPAPRSPADLFLSFSALALQGFGGVIAIAQRELVDRRGWLSNEEFLEEWAVAQTMPGPNVVNLAIVLGHRYFGMVGALTGIAGMLTAPLIVVLALAALYSHFANLPQVAGALRGLGAVASGLIASSAIKLFIPLRKHPLGMPLCLTLAALSFTCVALLRLPLVQVLLGLGTVSCLLTWRQLGKQA